MAMGLPPGATAVLPQLYSALISALRFNRAQRETKASEVVTSPLLSVARRQASIPPAPGAA